MEIMVNGAKKELAAYENGKNGSEWTEDLLGNYDALKYDYDKECYEMSEMDFAWWEDKVKKLNKIAVLEEQLSSEDREEYLKESFDGCDLENEIEEKLVWPSEKLYDYIKEGRGLISKLYDYMGHDIESLNNDTKRGYLSCNTGSNGKDYFWYVDEMKSVAIDMDGNIIDESNNDETLEGILY